MKKTLVCLLLVCISLFTLTGCGKGVSTKKMATEDEIEEFFEDKVDALEEMMEEVYSYKFKYVETYEYNSGANEQKGKTKIEGRVEIDPENPEDSALYEKYSQTEKSVEYGSAGKVKSSQKIEKEITVVGETLYELVETTAKSGESKKTERYQEKNDIEDSVLQEIMKHLQAANIGNFENYFNGDQIYIDGDKCLLVSSSNYEHREITLTFDGDELVSIEIFSKAHGYESELEVEFGKIKSISKPKNSSKYTED